MRNFWSFSIAGLMLASSVVMAQTADSAKTMSIQEMALYQGADRNAKLLEGAKKEGTLVVYHVYPALTQVLNEFSLKYGIKVKTWRAGSEAVLQRVISENKGNKFDVDIVQNNAPENEAAYREKLLQEVRTPLHADLLAQAVPAHKQWVGITMDIWTAAYNTDKIKKEDLPKTYKDLLDPKWKGQLGIEGNNHAWFGALMNKMGEEDGQKLFANITSTNGMSNRKGHSLLTMMVSSGEVPLALTVYSWNPEQLKVKGAPVEGLALQPLMAQPSTIAMLKKSPNPHAALLFYDYMLNEGQKQLHDLKFVPTSKKYELPFPKVPLNYIDPAMALDQQARWFKMFEETVVKRAK